MASSATADVTAPADMGVVTAPTKIVGTAAVEGMTKHTLAYALVQTSNEDNSE